MCVSVRRCVVGLRRPFPPAVLRVPVSACVCVPVCLFFCFIFPGCVRVLFFFGTKHTPLSGNKKKERPQKKRMFDRQPLLASPGDTASGLRNRIIPFFFFIGETPPVVLFFCKKKVECRRHRQLHRTESWRRVLIRIFYDQIFVDYR